MGEYKFDWDDENKGHISGHVVEPEECEECFDGKRYTAKAKTVRGESRYRLLGRTYEGRYLKMIYTLRYGKIRVITASDMRKAEMRLFRRRAK